MCKCRHTAATDGTNLVHVSNTGRDLVEGFRTSGQAVAPQEWRSCWLPHGCLNRSAQPGREQAAPHRWLPHSQSHSPSCPGTLAQTSLQFGALPLRTHALPRVCFRPLHM